MFDDNNDDDDDEPDLDDLLMEQCGGKIKTERLVGLDTESKIGATGQTHYLGKRLPYGKNLTICGLLPEGGSPKREVVPQRYDQFPPMH